MERETHSAASRGGERGKSLELLENQGAERKAKLIRLGQQMPLSRLWPEAGWLVPPDQNLASLWKLAERNCSSKCCFGCSRG